jgi:hypothetical protein
MKTIKDLNVSVTYKVGLGNISVSEKVFKQLNEIAEKGGNVDLIGMFHPEAVEWLRDTIRQRDCYDIDYDIIELS